MVQDCKGRRFKHLFCYNIKASSRVEEDEALEHLTIAKQLIHMILNP
jgi:hypothetical protein